ncbi:hypothetical protein [Pararhodobacter sp.]|uniref:hypothetical protein n=1 Tax=Pararhodobacter sp. TaxID=2127056 RepID=UPI002FDE2B9B
MNVTKFPAHPDRAFETEAALIRLTATLADKALRLMDDGVRADMITTTDRIRALLAS